MAVMEKPKPLSALPADYREVHYFTVNKPGVLLWLNLLSLIPMVICGLMVFGTLLVYHEEIGGFLVLPFLPEKIPTWAGLGLLFFVLPLHEWLHGLAIQHYGHRPRYGFKLIVLYATSDGAYFRRNEFIRIALAPLVIITLVGMPLLVFFPMEIGRWLAWTITLNAAGSIGDLWMTSVALRYDPTALILDEEDSMRVFMRVAVHP
jgi:hypothetical protein